MGMIYTDITWNYVDLLSVSGFKCRYKIEYRLMDFLSDAQTISLSTLYIS